MVATQTSASSGSNEVLDQQHPTRQMYSRQGGSYRFPNLQGGQRRVGYRCLERTTANTTRKEDDDDSYDTVRSAETDGAAHLALVAVRNGTNAAGAPAQG